MKLAHSVCTGEMFVRPELWWGAWPGPVLTAVQLGSALAGSTRHSRQTPRLPFGVMVLFNISGELPKATGGGCQPYSPPHSSLPAGSAPPAPWGLARKSETQRPRGCSPCFPQPPVVPLGTGSANRHSQAQVHCEDLGLLWHRSDTPWVPSGQPAGPAQSEPGVGTKPGHAVAHPGGGQALLDPSLWEHQAAEP